MNFCTIYFDNICLEISTEINNLFFFLRVSNIYILTFMPFIVKKLVPHIQSKSPLVSLKPCPHVLSQQTLLFYTDLLSFSFPLGRAEFS